MESIFREEKKLDELGFEPKTFRMRSEHSTPELHAHRQNNDKFLFLACHSVLVINERPMTMNIPMTDIKWFLCKGVSNIIDVTNGEEYI